MTGIRPNERLEPTGAAHAGFTNCEVTTGGSGGSAVAVRRWRPSRRLKLRTCDTRQTSESQNFRTKKGGCDDTRWYMPACFSSPPVAQRSERGPYKPVVVGSIPAGRIGQQAQPHRERRQDMRAEISYDLVVGDDMEFVEGTYRLLGGDWKVVIVSGSQRDVAVSKKGAFNFSRTISREP
jgi:hypothetical protein